MRLSAGQANALLVATAAQRLACAALVQQVEHFLIECRNVDGLADVVHKRGPACHRASIDKTGRYQHPAAMADDEDILAQRNGA
jgi:hypothetical protein